MMILFSKYSRRSAHSDFMKTTACIFILSLFSFLAGCSSNDPNPEQLHYYNPVWSPNSKLVVFGLYRGVPSSDVSTSSLLYLADTTGRRAEFSVAPMNTVNRRFWIDPVSSALAFTQRGISFYSIPNFTTPATSSLLGTFTPSISGRQPSVMAFSPVGHSFLWAGSSNGMLTIAHVTYADQPWIPTKESVLFDSVTTTSALDIIYLSTTTFAVRLSDGKIREFDLSKTVLHDYSVVPFLADNPWQYHIAYYNVKGNPQRIYAAQQNGFVECLLDSLKVKPLVEGGLVNYDVNEANQFMIYETTSFDIWLADQNAGPLSRLFPHNGMGRFSPDGYFLAAVGKITPVKDSITVYRFK